MMLRGKKRVLAGWLVTLHLLVVLALNLGCPALAEAAPPYVGSAACCLMDLDTGQLLWGKNHYEPRPVASTTKVMTALLALEYTRPDEVATVSPKAATTESGMGLEAGDKMLIGDLLRAALIESANDAAVVLAEYVAGSEEMFAYLMNKKAYILGACHTHFCNASGLPNDQHLSTCYDLAVITRYAMRNPALAEIVATRETTIGQPGYPAGRRLYNTNRLLGSYDGTIGVKTGTTNAAGQCLIAAARRGNRRLVSVVLRSWDRYGDSVRLLNYGFNSFSRQQIIDKDDVFKRIRLKEGKQLKVAVYPERDVYLWLPEERTGLEKVVKMDYQPVAPLVRGEQLGEMEVRYMGTTVSRVPLVTHQAVEKEPEGILRILYRLYLQVEKELWKRYKQ